MFARAKLTAVGIATLMSCVGETSIDQKVCRRNVLSAKLPYTPFELDQ